MKQNQRHDCKNISSTITAIRNLLSAFPALEEIAIKCYYFLYYMKNQQDATLAVFFISNCKITLHVSEDFCFHHQEY